jgi:small-conductance mechanosensitive channel
MTTQPATPAATDGAADSSPQPLDPVFDRLDAAANATPEPVDTATGAVTATEGIREVAAQNETAGTVVEAIDAVALTLGDNRISMLDVLVVIGIIGGVLLFAWGFGKVVRRGIRKFSGFDATQQLLAEKLVTIAVWAVAFLIGIDLLGIDLTALAVFSGAFGLAIGFGLQKTFGNLIAGIILLMDRSIKPGDVIAVTDQAGKESFGQIRKIGIRAVSVTTRDQREYLIPNENLMINQVENWSYSSKNVRMQVPVGVSYGCDIGVAEKLMLEAAKDCPRVLDIPPPTVWLDGYGNSSVDFVIQCWIKDPEDGVGNVRSQVLKNLWWLFQENDIEIPFPQRDLNLRGNEQFDQLIAAVAQRIDTSGKEP